jgi:hypothetical protein
MSHSSTLSERLGRALGRSDNGVVGLVDELLAASLQQDIQLSWQAGRCCVSFLKEGLPDRMEVPVPKPVVRAALARVAALCNERNPNSVSPYGGQGEVVLDTDPARAIRVSFVNTPETQSLELASAQSELAADVTSRPDGSAELTGSGRVNGSVPINNGS